MFKVGDKVKRQVGCSIAERMVAGSVWEVSDIDIKGGWLNVKDSPYMGAISRPFDVHGFDLAEPRRMEAHKEAYRKEARANDPITSKGKRKVNKYEQAVLDILRGLYVGQGYTGKQIASLTGHPLNCITPRFAPLRRKGLIKDSGIKRDKQIVWVLA